MIDFVMAPSRKVREGAHPFLFCFLVTDGLSNPPRVLFLNFRTKDIVLIEQTSGEGCSN
jgi:hypothetical protein